MLTLNLALQLIVCLPLEPSPAEQVAASQPAGAESRPTTSPARSAAMRKPEQARILEQLIRDAERPRPIIPDATAAQARGKATNGSLLLEGTMIVERAGRLIRAGEQLLLETRLDGQDSPRKLPLVPNAWLEAMEGEAAAGNTEFIVTAEVTRYRGQNYLIIRKARRQVAHGNLSP
ncbi:MAG: hypothetical protein HRF50_17110 [Phycisphaerae bacterium]